MANTIEDGSHRVAEPPQIYVRSEASVFGFANTIAEVARRIAPPPQIYVGLESPIKIVTPRACRAPEGCLFLFALAIFLVGTRFPRRFVEQCQ